jgi:hypothetical protein
LKEPDVLSWQLSQAESDQITGYWCSKETMASVEEIRAFLGAEFSEDYECQPQQAGE